MVDVKEVFGGEYVIDVLDSEVDLTQYGIAFCSVFINVEPESVCVDQVDDDVIVEFKGDFVGDGIQYGRDVIIKADCSGLIVTSKDSPAYWKDWQYDFENMKIISKDVSIPLRFD